MMYAKFGTISMANNDLAMGGWDLWNTQYTYFDNGKQYIDTVEQVMSTRTFVFAVMLSFQRGV